MRNYFYTDKLAARIQELLAAALSESTARNISTGDFGILPAPDYLNDYLPAIIIEQTQLEVTCAHEGLGIFYQPHQFCLWYFYPYEFNDWEPTAQKGARYLQEVANVLMNQPTLSDYRIEPSPAEAGGRVINAQVLRLSYDNAETKLFRAMELPLFVGRIDYQVDFRTYQEV